MSLSDELNTIFHRLESAWAQWGLWLWVSDDMDGSLGIKWPLSPYAAAAALGAALLTLCLAALWNRDSAEEEDRVSSEEPAPVLEEPRADLESTEEQCYSSKSDKSPLVIRIRELELRWGERSVVCPRLLSPTVHSSFLDIRDDSTSPLLPGVGSWRGSIQSNAERRGDNELGEQKSIDVIRREFVSVVRDTSGLYPVPQTKTSQKSDGDELKGSPSRILDSYFRRSVHSRTKYSCLDPFTLRGTKSNAKYSRLRGFSSLPDVFNVPPKFPLFLTNLDSSKSTIAKFKCDGKETQREKSEDGAELPDRNHLVINKKEMEGDRRNDNSYRKSSEEATISEHSKSNDVDIRTINDNNSANTKSKEGDSLSDRYRLVVKELEGKDILSNDSNKILVGEEDVSEFKSNNVDIRTINDNAPVNPRSEESDSLLSRYRLVVKELEGKEIISNESGKILDEEENISEFKSNDVDNKMINNSDSTKLKSEENDSLSNKYRLVVKELEEKEFVSNDSDKILDEDENIGKFKLNDVDIRTVNENASVELKSEESDSLSNRYRLVVKELEEKEIISKESGKILDEEENISKFKSNDDKIRTLNDNASVKSKSEDSDSLSNRYRLVVKELEEKEFISNDSDKILDEDENENFDEFKSNAVDIRTINDTASVELKPEEIDLLSNRYSLVVKELKEKEFRTDISYRIPGDNISEQYKSTDIDIGTMIDNTADRGSENENKSSHYPMHSSDSASQGGQHFNIASPGSFSQRYEADDALIADSCVTADTNTNNSSHYASIASATSSGNASQSPMTAINFITEHLERLHDAEKGEGNNGSVKTEQEIVVSQVDHLAPLGGCSEPESVTVVKGSVEGDSDVTGEEVPRSREGTIWGVAASDDRPQLLAVGCSMDVEDPIDAIVRDLRGICEGLHINGGPTTRSKSTLPTSKSIVEVSSVRDSKSVVEVSSVSECLFRPDSGGTIESSLSLETAFGGSEELSSVHQVSSVFRDGNVRVSHRIESSSSVQSDGIICGSPKKQESEDLCRFIPRELGRDSHVEDLDKVTTEIRSPLREQRPETPPLSRLMVLLDRDQERRAKSKYSGKINGSSSNGNNTAQNGISNSTSAREIPGGLTNGSPRPDAPEAHRTSHEGSKPETEASHVAQSGEGAEWEALMRDVLASVSELESWEAAAGWRCDRGGRTREVNPPSPQHSASAMEATTPPSLKVATTPTKVKNLRFKLDPDVYDVPSDDSFYDEEEDRRGRSAWRSNRHQSKYQAFSALELGRDEPVQLVSVRTSVVPPGQKVVVKPVVGTDDAGVRLRQLDIDLHIRLDGGEDAPSKRGHHGGGPAQAKRKSPVSDRTGWCQELSPVSENVDWRETWSAIDGAEGSPKAGVARPVPNGILKTSPKTETIVVDKSNPFKKESEGGEKSPTKSVSENGVVTPVKSTPTQNGVHRKLFLPRKKFVPDPEAIERITGYKVALSKPPLPPPPINRTSPSPRLGGTAKKRTDSARKQYFDHKAALAAAKSQESSNQKFQQFLAQAQTDRARIVTSTPDLGAIEQAVMTQWLKEKASPSQNNTSSEQLDDTRDETPSRSTTPDDVWMGYVQMCRRHLNRRSRSLCYLETDIDAITGEEDKAISLTALNESEPIPLRLESKDPGLDESAEDLDSGHAKSEHEIRVEKSLRNLSLPDWYRNCEKPKSGFLLGSSNVKEKKGWAAAKSLASSTSSLTSIGMRKPRSIRSLRSSQENIPWSRGSVSPAEMDRGLSRNGPALSLALARAFREPYLGWRARTPSSGVSSSPQVDISPPSWVADSCDTPLTSDLPPMDEEAVSFDGEDVILVNTSSEVPTRESDGDTCEDVVTMSMDTCDGQRELAGEDTCDDINNMSMDTCELFPPPTNGEQKSSPLAGDDTCDDVRNISSDTAGINGHPSPLNTGDDINNLSTDASESQDDSSVRNGDSSSIYQQKSKRSDMKRKRYSYSQSIYHSEWDEDAEGKKESSTRESSPANKVIWIESSFVGSRTTTSIVVLPTQKDDQEHHGNGLVRPASR